ncbi:hypothetical protein XHC_4129 [Xanthomonas hortorum pv. carotae str. M081]|nr:hypothetical protein XHC_4129 [Xanthomonas hortorum pv. carotae str. M081]
MSQLTEALVFIVIDAVRYTCGHHTQAPPRRRNVCRSSASGAGSAFLCN